MKKCRLPTAAFDYGCLAPAAAAAGRIAAQEIAAANCRARVIIGQQLEFVQSRFSTEQFSSWAQAEVGISRSTARNYINVARFLKGKPETLSVLPELVVYALSSPGAPAEWVREVVEAAEAGAPMPAVEIVRRLVVAQADSSARQARKRRQRSAGARI